MERCAYAHRLEFREAFARFIAQIKRKTFILGYQFFPIEQAGGYGGVAITFQHGVAMGGVEQQEAICMENDACQVGVSRNHFVRDYITWNSMA